MLELCFGAADFCKMLRKKCLGETCSIKIPTRKEKNSPDSKLEVSVVGSYATRSSPSWGEGECRWLPTKSIPFETIDLEARVFITVHIKFN